MKPREKPPNYITIFAIAIVVCLATTAFAVDDYSDLVVANSDETRSRILMVDGNIYFHAGKSKNITFRVSDNASIWFDKTDIQNLPNSSQIEELNIHIARFSSHLHEIDYHLIGANEKTLGVETKVRELGYELATLRQNFTDFAKRKKDKANSRLRKSINQLAGHILNFTKLIAKNECINQPCENGGTCIDLIAKFQCLCPAHYNGKRCENRIDECALYASTPVGCKNNATCTNNGALPGIKCHCPSGFYGTHCQLRSSSCDLNLDLCGEHGHCLPSPSADGSKESYRCLCEFGYVSDNDPDNPTCVDIDECARKPCYPGAGCVNTPGGFRCTSCPAGMQGNGIQCTDFDECASEFTNDCSKSPKVQCLNHFGGYTCGPCPKGYKGDGKKCEIEKLMCSKEHCSSLATCTDTSAFSAVCKCKEGYSGDGIGKYGCQKLNETKSEDLSCYVLCNGRGDCEYREVDGQDENERYCECEPGFIGKYCEHSDVCVGKTCGYRGTCKVGYGQGLYNPTRVPVCECIDGFYGDNCEHEEASQCGFHTHNETGVIVFNGSEIMTRISCQWTIQLLDSRKIIQFQFENYTTKSFLNRFQKSCQTAFGNISIHDGLSASQPLIGTFCQDAKAPAMPFYTSGGAAQILFTSNEVMIDSYLRITWKAASPRCGGRLTGSTGTISYSDIHDEDVCIWYISVPPEYHLELSVKSVTMGTKDVVNCSVNSLEVFDHQSAVDSLRILELCESITKPRIVRTTVPYATVYFRTDRRIVDPNLGTVNCDGDEPSSWCGVGFTINYRVIELEADCGGEFRPDSKGQMSGYITSPHYPHSYFPNLNCLWRLDASVENSTDLSVPESARKVRIEFIDFDVQTNVLKLEMLSGFHNLESCMGDNVRLLPKGGVFCNMRPPSGTYSNNHFELGFRSDESGTGRGFKLKYESVCEMDFTERNGTIQSPGYPTPSKTPFKCTYRIIATKREAIRVIFRKIKLPHDALRCWHDKKAQATTQDYIEFNGGHATHEQINKRYVCARYPVVEGGEVTTSGNVPFSITYSTSGHEENHGFIFDYEIVDVGCGGFFYTPTGVLTSPGYPEKYSSHMFCIYEIVSGSANQIRLEFDVFEVELVPHSEGCGFDNVRVFDSFYTDEDDHGELLGVFCGHAKPPPLISRSNKMAVVFMSDRSVNGVGFSAKYRVVKADTECDRTFSAESGVIEYNGTQFPRNTKCEYIIALPKMHRISLSFENISMSCHKGQITIKNGMSETSPDFPGFEKLCDNPHPVRLITQGNRAFIRVTTTSPTTTYFRLRYEVFAAGCGGRVNGISGYFSAPQYPDKDSRSLDCSWTVSVAEGNKVKLTFPFIDDLNSGNMRGECTAFSANFLEVIDSENRNNLLRRYCVKETSTAAVLAESNKLEVRYVQHGGSYQGSLFGFLGHFTTDCEDVVFTSHHGTIQSPNYGTSDNTPLNCKYTIRTSPGSRIRVIFHSFNMAYPCSSSNLRVPKSQISNFTLTADSRTPYNDFRAPGMQAFCQINVPSEITSVSNVMELNFKAYSAGNNFWLSYSTIGCGDIIYVNNTLVAVSQSDFTPNSTVRECAWTVRAPVGYVIRFKIDYAYFMGNPEGGSKCDDIVNPHDEEADGIAFYSGTSNASGVPQKILCQTLKNVSYLSHTNELHMRMRLSKSNIQHSTKGYVLYGGIYFEKYNLSKEAQCGGIVEVNPTKNVTITSPGYPAAYDNGIKCIWEFRATEGSMVHFNLKEFTNPSGDRRQVHALLYPSDDVITNCSVSLSYLEGGLSFYRGGYNQSENYFWNKKMVFRVCNGLSAPYDVDPTSDTAVVIFQGSSQPRVTESGDDAKSHGGFVLEAYAKCGGRLVAEQKPKTFLVEHDGVSSAVNECEYAFERNTDDEDEGDILYIRGEHLYESNIISTGDSFTITCGTEVEETLFMDSYTINEARDWGTCNDKLLLKTQIMPNSGRYLITYGLENTFCGGVIKGARHESEFDVDPNREIDCEWNFIAPGGEYTSLSVVYPLLPESELCQENYIEVRLSNESTARPRVCGTADRADFAAANITVRLRYRPDKDNIPDEPQWNMKLKSRLMETTTPLEGWLEPNGHSTIHWELVAPENKSYVKLVFEKYNIPPQSGVTLEVKGECEDCTYKIEGFLNNDAPPEIYWIPSGRVTFDFHTYSTLKNRPFLARWEGVTVAEYNKHTSSKKAETLEEYTCGTELTAAFEKQTLVNPTNSFGNYDNEMRCLWTIKNPNRFSDLNLQIKKLDFEYSTSCTYDYIRIDRDLGVGLGDNMKYCNALKSGPLNLTAIRNAKIEMITDRSRVATGFEIDYWQGCNSHNYITLEDSPFEGILTSPGYPDQYRKNESCAWTVILESRRAINVSVEVDLEGTDGQCTGDYLVLMTRPFGEEEIKHCGTKNFTYVADAGRIFITFQSDNLVYGNAGSNFGGFEYRGLQGFKMTMKEIVNDCSSDQLFVDEHHPIKVLSSPHNEYGLIDNSIDCKYVMTAPTGHRIKFTVDPLTFNLQSTGNTCGNDDYLEIRDGPSELAPLIGIYCGTDPPSTIYSTGSSLFARLTTDIDVKSVGFNATYELASCGGSVVLSPGQNSTITSPNYPMPYPAKSDCGWTVKAPLGHFVQASVERMTLKYSENCTDGYVAMHDRNATGDYILEPSCTSMAITSSDSKPYQSVANMMYVEFKTNSTGKDAQQMMHFCPSSVCGFEIEVAATKYECGGEITDDEGTITLPGYPNPITAIKCQWKFNAGIGNVYVLSFEFIDDTDGFYINYNKDRCYPNLVFSDAIPYKFAIGARTDFQFCMNMTNYVGESDMLRLEYVPHVLYLSRSKLNISSTVPWSVSYKKIPGSKKDRNCNRYITEDLEWHFNKTDLGKAKSFCHLRIKRPFDGTTMIEVKNMSFREESLVTSCDYGNFIQLKSLDESPWNIDQEICNTTNHHKNYSYPFPNAEIDLLAYVNVIPFDDFHFDLSVKFFPCGGTIDPEESQSGVITSPNFGDGNVYDKNTHCLWFLRAPEGHVVELEIGFMDLESHVECKNDALVVAEGEHTEHSVIHRYQTYCKGADEPVPDRFKKIRSRSRELTLYWHSDSNVQRKGFNLTYSFVLNNDKGCGFTSHSGSGLITTPNYPKDYPNNANCIWDIIVPNGYHVKLEFDDFDVQLSRDCDKDYLLLSQEYQSRALAPLGDYYFYFEHEEKQPTMCGNELPKPFIAESNRIRLNFTTDAATSGRGFKARWSTQCGSVMALTHGVITSPHYPLGYPNEDLYCQYLIYPQLPDSAVPIITLKILDIDLASYNIWGETVPPADECWGDYLEIIDVSARNKSLMKLCSHHLKNVTELPPIAVHGGIGVRFAANSTRFESSKLKKSRGFKLSYALADCGGDIRLDGTSDRLTSVISSPGYPLPYHGNLDCVWNVTAPKGRVISAKFVAISIEKEDSEARCIYDFVEMYNGHVMNFSTNYRANITDNRMIGRYCGSTAPKDFIITEGRNLTVRFRSDHSKSLGGFKLVLAATLGPEGGCGGSLTANSDWKTLTPPLDAKGKYFNSLRCLWTIKASEKKKIIEFKFDQMNVESRRRIESNLTTCYDFVAIYDGPRATSSLLLPPTCAFTTELPITFQSSSKIADFYFESDTADSFDGFSVSYRTIPPDCGGYMNAVEEPHVASYESDRGLTRTNQRNKRCRWFFFSKNKQPVVLEFKQFNFPSADPTCPFEFLEIRDIGIPENCEHPACNRGDRPKDVLRYCGTDKPARFVSQSSVIEITTSVLTTSQYSGKFLLDYAVLDNCNRTIKIPDADSHFASGRITSPNYPNRYDDNTTCITVLSGPPDYQFFLVFKDFQVERGIGGYRGLGYRSGFGHRFDRYRTRGGFGYGRFGYDAPSPFWSPSCTYDKVTIELDDSSASNTTRKSKQTYCGHRVPPTQLSVNNEMRITLTTDDSMAGTGYDASYYMVRPARLGDHTFYDFHTIYDKSGVIAPISFPLSNNTIQRWKVAPPAGLECSFTVTELKLAEEYATGECNNTLRYAVMKADDKSATIPWMLLPCKESEVAAIGADGLIQKTKASVHYFEARISDSTPSYLVPGFRIEWTCDNYSEDVI